MRLALPEVTDEDLGILTLIFMRGAPISAQTAQEWAAVERFSTELELAGQKMAAQDRSDSMRSPASRTRLR